MRSLGASLLLLTAFVWLPWVPEAQAYIPPADRTLRAIAEVNRASGRSKAIQLELTMRIGENAPIASGQLISHPSGLARLELRGYNGRVDRYLLSGRELLGAKDGLAIDRPQPMLQPIFFLQPSSGVTLRTALDSFGVLSNSIGLATCGDEDCFVIGDPRLEAPLASAAGGTEAFASGDSLEDPLADPMAVYDLAATEEPQLDSLGLGPGDLEGPDLPIAIEARLPRLWVDTEELQVRRIDRASGVFTIFGPFVSFDKLVVPAWFEIHEPGAAPIRFEVDRAVQVNAPPTAFSRKWLLTPVEPPSPEAGLDSGSVPTSAP